MAGLEELSDTEEEEGEEQTAKNNQDGNVCLESGDEEDESQEAPQDQENTQGKAVCAVIAVVCSLDTKIRDVEHGEGKPESTIRTVDSGTEGVANAEFHEPCEKLGNAAEEDSQTEDGLVRANAAERVVIRKSIEV